MPGCGVGPGLLDHAVGALTEAELFAFCEARLAGYKKPKRAIFVDELPKTAIGKASRRALAEPFWKGMQRRTH